jgi:hypothetical protein
LGIFHSHPSIFPSRHFFSPWLLPHAQQAKRREQGQPWRGTLPASPGERLGQGAFFPNATPAPSNARHLLWSELEQRARRHPWRGTSAPSPPAAMALFPVLQRPSSLPFSVHGEQELFPPMARRRCSLFFSISLCSLGCQQPWRGLLFFFLAQQQAPPWQAPRQASPMAPAAGISSPSPWRPENSSRLPLLLPPASSSSTSLPWHFPLRAALSPLSSTSGRSHLAAAPCPFFFHPADSLYCPRRGRYFSHGRAGPLQRASPFPSAAQLLHGETPLFLQPRHLPLLPRCQRCARATCLANCPSGVLRSEQHVGMPTGCLLFCAAPSSSSFAPVRPRRLLLDFRIDVIFL